MAAFGNNQCCFKNIENSKSSEISDGSEANPSISFSADQDTGIYRSGDGQISISSNGSRVASFDGSGLLLPLGNSPLSIYSVMTPKSLLITRSDGITSLFSTPQNINVNAVRVGNIVVVCLRPDETTAQNIPVSDSCKIPNLLDPDFRPTTGTNVIAVARGNGVRDVALYAFDQFENGRVIIQFQFGNFPVGNGQIFPTTSSLCL